MATDELESKAYSDADVEAKRIEAYERVEKSRVESTENLQRGWQDVITKITSAVERSWKYGREVESRHFRNTIIVIVVLFVGVGLLTWQKIVPGEAFALLVGTVIGYLLSMSPLGSPPAK